MSKPIIELNNISKKYIAGKQQKYYSLRDTLMGVVRSPLQLLKSKKINSAGLYENEFWALKDVSFNINPGEVVGIIGPNGAGKSTLLKILSRVTPPSSGEIVLRGRAASLLEVGTGFHQELTGRENVFLNGSILGMKRWEIKKKFNEIVEFAGIEQFLDTPVKHYSSGMYMRLAFSVAAHLEPEILLVDEVLAVGDAVFQKKSLDKMKDVSTKEGRTVLLVSHNMSAIQRLCQKVILFDHGSVIAEGLPEKVIPIYLSPGGQSQKAEIIWESKEKAPGDETIRLKSVKILDKNNKLNGQIDITEPLKIEIQYWNLKNASITSAGFYLKTPDGYSVLSSFDFHSLKWGNKPKPAGLYKSCCNIPGNFLAEGCYSVSPVVNSFVNTSICNADCDAITFEVVDYGKKCGVRGDYKGVWPGVIRPKLRWQIIKKN